MTTLISFFIVAFGQPAFVPWLGLLAAAFGYALFWSKGYGFWTSTLWFMGIQLIQLSWMTSDEYQGLYTWFFWVFLSFGMGVQFGLVSLLVKRRWAILMVPAAWTIMEWLRLYFLAGMTWNPVGLALTGWLVPMQMVSLVGIFGLSFWVMLTNMLVLKGRKLMVLALFPYVFGFVHLAVHTHFQNQEKDHLSVLLVQPGICPGERSGVGCGVQGMISPEEQWNALLGLVAPYEKTPLDLIVFPEGLAPYEAYQLQYGGFTNAFLCQEIANAMNADVIAGLDYRLGKDVYNAALFFQPGETELSNWYGKRVLLPIVEDLSNPIFAPVAKMYGIQGGFAKGSEAVVFEGKVPMGPSICYEETFSAITRENRGAELLVNLSNDGWYPNSRLPEQHFYHGRLRAVENGLPLVRACSIGVTCAVDSLGRTVAELPSGTVSGALHTNLSPYHYKTLYGMFGDGLVLGASFLIVLLFFRYK